jgi:hypothetical protein
MSWIGQRPSSFVGQVVGSGECIAYVQRASGAPQTALWRRGELVKGGNVAQGTAITTFDPIGVYGPWSMADRTRPFSMSNFPKACSSGTNGSITLTPGDQVSKR